MPFGGTFEEALLRHKAGTNSANYLGHQILQILPSADCQKHQCLALGACKRMIVILGTSILAVCMFYMMEPPQMLFFMQH